MYLCLMKKENIFIEVEDFRQEKKCTHKLSKILFITLCTYICGAEDFADMVLFAENDRNNKFLEKYCDMTGGVPSHDTFRRVFISLEPHILEGLLKDYGMKIVGLLSEKQICIDGKKQKRVAPTSRGNQGCYIVSAWVAENQICVGQQRVEDKSNEITAIPEVIASLDIEDAIVTIDAIDCQREIAQQIVDKKGHYLLSVKSNQSELYESIIGGFKAQRATDIKEDWDKLNGRYEVRRCSILSASDIILQETINQWAGLKTIVKIEAERHINGEVQSDTRYYISDEEISNAKYYNELARGHWSIENQQHWF